jgi:hypothetical protein
MRSLLFWAVMSSKVQRKGISTQSTTQWVACWIEVTVYLQATLLTPEHPLVQGHVLPVLATGIGWTDKTYPPPSDSRRVSLCTLGCVDLLFQPEEGTDNVEKAQEVSSPEVLKDR